MYKGKAICQGCKKTGNESPRNGKDFLCKHCLKIFELGKSELKHTQVEYVRVRQMIHAFRDSISWDDKGYINEFVYDILRAYDNPCVKEYEWVDPIKNAFGDNCVFSILPKNIYEPLKKLCLDLEKIITEIRNRYEEIPNLAKLEVQKEKDRIYNEGIEKGKNLLFSLNSGELTMSDFEKNLKYNNLES